MHLQTVCKALMGLVLVFKLEGPGIQEGGLINWVVGLDIVLKFI
jgi:hypothetical protein